MTEPDAETVRVEPMRPDWAEALLEGDDVFAARFGIPVVAGWVGFPEALEPEYRRVSSHGADPWASHLFFDVSDGALVGFGGFKGAPRDGVVEIGYAIAPDRQGLGLATAAATTLITRARRAGVTTVIAHTLAEDNPSTSVLRKCGFIRTGEIIDEDLGEAIWRWELVSHPGERV